MQGQDLLDLVEGSNEWCNIPTAIRSSFRVFNELILSQAKYTHLLEEQLKEFAARQDKYNEITQGTLDEMLGSFSKFSTHIYSTTPSTPTTYDSKYVTRAEFESATCEMEKNLIHAMKQLDNHSVLASQLSTKVDSTIFERELERIDNAIAKKEYWAEEQRDTQYSHLVSALSQLEESCKSLSGDIEQVHETILGKASKTAVAGALKKRVSHEELDVAVQQIIEEVNGIVKKSMVDNEAKMKSVVTDQLSLQLSHALESHTCNNNAENSPPIVMLERQISKNFAEINKMVLDLDMKPDRTELQQLEESLENHFKLISGISQDLVDLRHAVQQSNDVSVELQHNLRQSVQQAEATVEVQQSSMHKVGKAIQELHRLLAGKADKVEVEQSMSILVQIERQLRDLESRLLSPRAHEHNSIEPSTGKVEIDSQSFAELLKVIESKADREDLSRISKMIIDIESANHWHQEEEERRHSGMVRQVRSEVERYARTEIDRCVRSEVELHFHTAIERKENEWKEERQEELAVKANLAEVHQVRKETTELGSRILACTKELHDLQASIPRRLDTLLSSRDMNETSALKDKSSLQLRVALDQLTDEFEQLKGKLKKKIERGELQELLKTWQDTNAPPASPTKGKIKSYVTKDELTELLKQKVGFNELMNSLSLKMDKNELQHDDGDVVSSRDGGVNGKHANSLLRDCGRECRECRESRERVKSVELLLATKVDSRDFTELSELVRKKVDVTVFLQAKTDLSDNARKLDRDVRDLAHALRSQNPSSNLAHSPKKQTFLDPPTTTNSHLPLSRPLPSSSSSHPISNHSADPPLSSNYHSHSSSHHHPSPPRHSSSAVPNSNTGSGGSGGGSTTGRWFKDVRPATRYLEILKELNKGLSSDSGVP